MGFNLDYESARRWYVCAVDDDIAETQNVLATSIQTDWVWNPGIVMKRSSSKYWLLVTTILAL